MQFTLHSAVRQSANNNLNTNTNWQQQHQLATAHRLNRACRYQTPSQMPTASKQNFKHHQSQTTIQPAPSQATSNCHHHSNIRLPPTNYHSNYQITNIRQISTTKCCTLVSLLFLLLLQHLLPIYFGFYFYFSFLKRKNNS